MELIYSVLIIAAVFLFICIIVKVWLYYEKWNEIESLNKSVGITRENAYIDEKGYLRWNSNDRLCHRDIAWNAGLRGKLPFGQCDVHHVDLNKLNCDPSNLKVLTRTEHQRKHPW